MGPNHPTALLRDSKQQFKSIGHFGLRIYLEACAAGRIVNNVAINNGSLRANDYFGLGTLARRANASKVSRIHYRPLPLIRNSSDRLADYPENFVSVYGYRTTSCGGRWSAGSRADSQPEVLISAGLAQEPMFCGSFLSCRKIPRANVSEADDHGFPTRRLCNQAASSPVACR